MRKSYVLAIALLVAAVLAGQFRSSAQNSTSATFTVNSLNDTPDATLADGLCADTSGACTLRAAIQQANADPLHDTINLNVTGAIDLMSELPELSTHLTINGPGANQLTVRRAGAADYRIFTVLPGVTAAISGLTISNGRAPLAGGSTVFGGGISNSGTLALSDCSVTNNSTAPAPVPQDIFLQAGGGGGIRNEGTLTITRCSINGNFTGQGSIRADRKAGTEGGGIFNSGSLVMIDSVVSGNSTADALSNFLPGDTDLSAGGGGGIRNLGVLTMTGCTVSNNTTGKGGTFSRGLVGYAGGSGGGISNSATLVMADCAVSGNSTGSGGEGPLGAGNGGDGGGIFSFGSLKLTSCSVSQNRTGAGGNNPFLAGGQGGHGGHGGGISSFGAATIIKSTVSYNVTGAGGFSHRAGGGGGSGGGIYGSATVTDSTISGNSTGRGSGSSSEDVSLGNGGDGGGVFSTGMKLSNSTVVFNSTGAAGGGRDGLGGGIHGVTRIRSTIVALNTVPFLIEGRDVFGVFDSAGYNYIGVTGGVCCFNNTDLVNFGVDSGSTKIGPLADNGGVTPTHELLPGSPAIDKALGLDVDNQPAPLDQRGLPRPFDNPAIAPAAGGDNSDIGAFERQDADAAPSPTPTASPTFVQFSASTYQGTEGCGPMDVTVVRSGPKELTTELIYVTSNGKASQRGDFTYQAGRLTFAPGEDTKTIPILISDDAYAEGVEDLNIFLVAVTGGALGSPNATTLQINDNETADGVANPIDDAGTFVCHHYHDFLGRQADSGGQGFWTNQITSCGTDLGCLAEKRENVSAAFFLSTEFQQIGYYVIRVNKVSFGNASNSPRYLKFLAATHKIRSGLVVGQVDYDALLEANKQRYEEELVSEFEWASGLSAEQYVDHLFANTSVTPTQAEHDAAIAAFGSGDTVGLARALRSVVESGSVYNKLYNQAFVQLQYFGYLRRNPSDAPDNNFNGYNFWLAKLNSFTAPGEDARDPLVALARVKRAEMVRAFLNSGEYRGRFLGDPNRGE